MKKIYILVLLLLFLVINFTYSAESKELKSFDYYKDKYPDNLDLIGTINGNKMYDIILEEILFYKDDSIKEIERKVIIEKENNKYELIYSTNISEDIGEIIPAYITKTITGNKILTIVTRFHGTGNFYKVDCFILDKFPKIDNLNVMDIREEETKRILPEGYGIWKGGNWDVKNLKYNSPVWKDGDYNPNPTGGEVYIKFSIEDNKLKIVDSQFKRAEDYFLNRKGEQLYREGKVNEAIDYFKKAIEINYFSGQYFSNLGLSYYKIGRIEEAIEANKKAITIAKRRILSRDKEIVLASSYFNLATIYEDEEEWEEALTYYKLALKEREHSAYIDGIKRMEEKISKSQ